MFSRDPSMKSIKLIFKKTKKQKNQTSFVNKKGREKGERQNTDLSSNPGSIIQ